MTSTIPATTSPAPTPAVATGYSRPSFVRLTRIELRKAVDYRAGRWILAVMVGFGLIAAGWMVYYSHNNPVSFQDITGATLTPAAFLLPVLGILAMTSEWTQRTALTTFTLTPRRIPVLIAKLVAALVLMVVVMVALIGVAALATLIATGVSNHPVPWGGTDWKFWVGQFGTQGLFVLMGAGIGALIPISGVALTTFYVAPTVFSFLSATLLKKVGDWFDVFAAFDRLGSFKLDGKGPQTLTAVLVWVVVPLVAGLWFSNRREVK